MNYNFISNQKNFYPINICGEDCIWNQSGVIFFNKNYTYEQLNSALNSIIRDYESFRCCFKESKNGPVSYIDSFEYKNFPFFEFESKHELNKVAMRFANHFQNNELFKAFVFNCGKSSGFFATFHHLIIDGYSMPIMAEYLNKYLNNERHSVNKLVSYHEFIRNEEKYVNSKRYHKDRNFWSQQFSLNPECSVFERKKTSFDYSSDEVNFRLHPELFIRIKAFCDKNNISVQSFFNTVYSTYIFRTLGVELFTLGVPVLNRTTEAEMNTVGLYMHIVPLLINISENSFIKNAIDIEDAQLTLFRHQKFTQHDIKELLKEEGRPVLSLFDVVADYQAFEENEDYDFEFLYSNSLSVPLEIHMQSFGCKKHNLKIRYRTSMFSEKEITTMASSIIAIAVDAIENPDKKIFELETVSADERKKLLIDFNDTAYAYNIPDNSTIYSLFEKNANENAERICIRTAESNITFGELLNISENLDTEIRRITGGKKSVIAVIAERSAEMYSAIYGIIRGGNAYLPIDPDYPQERIDYILENSKAAAVIAQGRFEHLAGNIPRIKMSEFIYRTEKNKDVPCCNATEEDTAYVIYTSGSTGTPKGAMVSHKSAVNRILWMHNKYPLEYEDVILQKTPYTFDVSVWEHFWWGICGGVLAVSKPGEHFLPAKILGEVKKHKVSHIHFVPSVFELFLNYLETHTDEVANFDSVRYVFLSGETLPASLVQRFYKIYDYSKVTLHNLYGPTECAVDVTYYACTPDDIDPVPIGKPIYNTQIYIVDKHMNPVPVGTEGELCIAGTNVGQGYINNNELTEEKFVENPFGKGKLYKTGDLAYWREDGEIVFCGRIDGQVKLNGQRIETAEIESVLSNISGIESVAVTVRKVNETDILVAFYCGEDNIESAAKEVCSERLPKYMVPAVFRRIDKLPLNQNGKLDRKMLSMLDFDIESNVNEIEKPVTDTERFICELFRTVLKTDNIGRNSDFFKNGGTSLSMISVLSEEVFRNITSAEFMRNPTPAELARIILEKRQNELNYLEPLNICENAEKVLILLPFAGGGAESYSNFVTSLKRKNNNISVYFIRYLHSLHECEKAADEISYVLKGKEILMYSHCVGSAIAIQLLSLLEKRNVFVKQYFAAASIPPANPTKKNIWNIIPDKLLKNLLIMSGAKISGMSEEKLDELFKHFRTDTDFASVSFYEFKNRIKAPVALILSKSDIFTLNYRQAEKNWKKFAETINGVFYINSNSHYFQSDNSEDLIDLLLSVIE